MTGRQGPALWSRRSAIAAGLLACCAPHMVGGARAGTPVRTQYGVNVAWLFLDELRPGGDGGTRKIESLGKRGVPFIRFAASAHFAGDWAHFDDDPKAYWARMDRLFAAAEHSGVGLVPSVLWRVVGLAYHCGEPMQAWTDPASRTRRLAERYVDGFVERYDSSPALLMYEFTNELNLWVDLPTVLHFWPTPDGTVPDRKPVEKDRLSSAQLRDFSGAFARRVRERSSTRPIGMGSSIPRNNAWNLSRGRWETDTADQFVEQLRSVTAREFDVLSVHVYEEAYGKNASVFATLPDLLAAVVRAAGLDGRKTFLGEFGVPRLDDRAEERRRFAAMMEAVRGAKLDYAALWNFATKPFQADWDVSLDNDRAYQINALVEANKAR